MQTMRMYYCIKDFVMNNGDVAFTKGQYYTKHPDQKDERSMVLLSNQGGHSSGIEPFYEHFIEYSAELKVKVRLGLIMT